MMYLGIYKHSQYMLILFNQQCLIQRFLYMYDEWSFRMKFGFGKTSCIWKLVFISLRKCQVNIYINKVCNLTWASKYLSIFQHFSSQTNKQNHLHNLVTYLQRCLASVCKGTHSSRCLLHSQPPVVSYTHACHACPATAYAIHTHTCITDNE